MPIIIIGPAAYRGAALVWEAIAMYDQSKALFDAGNLDRLFDIKNSLFYIYMENRLVS